MQFLVKVADESDLPYAKDVCDAILESSKASGAGIAKRTPEYIERKILNGQAVLAKTLDGTFAGFCYVETFGHGKYVANSGLIVAMKLRQHGLAFAIKNKAFQLSRSLFPDAKLFGLTTNCSVMGINSRLGYKPVSYAKLTDDEKFWDGCKSCAHYETLISKDYKNCLCTAMVFDPEPKVYPDTVKHIEYVNT